MPAAVPPPAPDQAEAEGCDQAAALGLLPASPEWAAAERRDRAAIAAEPPPVLTAPVPPDLLAAWEAELAGLLGRHPPQTITDPATAAGYFAAEARRRLGQVKHDQQAAGLLMGFWRHARSRP